MQWYRLSVIAAVLAVVLGASAAQARPPSRGRSFHAEMVRRHNGRHRHFHGRKVVRGYHRKFGRHFRYRIAGSHRRGWYYPGRRHYHWKYYSWNPYYRRWFFYDDYAGSFYFFSRRYGCYLPIDCASSVYEVGYEDPAVPPFDVQGEDSGDAATLPATLELDDAP
jgi:hypothetical protein